VNAKKDELGIVRDKLSKPHRAEEEDPGSSLRRGLVVYYKEDWVGRDPHKTGTDCTNVTDHELPDTSSMKVVVSCARDADRAVEGGVTARLRTKATAGASIRAR
jgi:hypothetical protein